jgi:predicted dehydrogenase
MAPLAQPNLQQSQQLQQSSSKQKLPYQKDIKWGFMSTAKITNKVKKAVDESSNGRVVAIASRTNDAASDWVKEHMEKGEEIAAYGTYEALLNDKNVQIVYIPLPSGIKKEWAIKAAHAKKHILCEKPFATAGEVQDIISACKQNNVCFWDNTMFLHHPRTKEMMSLIKSGELGELRHIHGEFSFVMQDDENIRLHKEVEPHGALGDLGWYPLKAVLLCVNMELPTKVFAAATFKNNVVQSLCAILYFKDPQLGATIHCGFSSSLHQSLKVSGTRKTLTVNDPFFPYHHDPFEYPKVDETGVTHYHLRDGEGRLETREVRATKRQEVNAIEKFGELQLRKSHGNLRPELELKYHTFSLNTQRVLDALEESARKGVIVDVKQS